MKWVLLALGVYAILWLFGLYASLVALPHRLEERGLRLRQGVFAEGVIPYAEIEDAVGTQRKAPNSGDGLSYVPEEDALYLATGGKTDAALRLRALRSMRGFLKETEPAYGIHLAVDEPDRFVRELRQRMETSISGSGVDRTPPRDRSEQRPKHATRHHGLFAKYRS